MILDGAKGFRAAVNQAFKKRTVIQRCMWHKRENAISYLPKSEQASWRRRLQRAYDRPTYPEAKAELTKPPPPRPATASPPGERMGAMPGSGKQREPKL